MKRLLQKNRDKEVKEAIQSIDTEHQGRYDYHRIHLRMQNRGSIINHKKVQRLMTELGLRARVRAKRRYNSYKGEVGLRLLIWFNANSKLLSLIRSALPMWLPASEQKLYLSPVLNGYNKGQR